MLTETIGVPEIRLFFETGRLSWLFPALFLEVLGFREFRLDGLVSFFEVEESGTTGLEPTGLLPTFELVLSGIGVYKILIFNYVKDKSHWLNRVRFENHFFSRRITFQKVLFCSTCPSEALEFE